MRTVSRHGLPRPPAPFQKPTGIVLCKRLIPRRRNRPFQPLQKQVIMEVKTAQNKKDYAVLSIATSESRKNDKDEYETRTECTASTPGAISPSSSRRSRRPARQPGGEDQVPDGRGRCREQAIQAHHRRYPRFQHEAPLESRSRRRSYRRRGRGVVLVPRSEE